jgi:hypothetical protein
VAREQNQVIRATAGAALSVDSAGYHTRAARPTKKLLKVPYSTLLAQPKTGLCASAGCCARATSAATFVQKMPVISASGQALPGSAKRRLAGSSHALALRDGGSHHRAHRFTPHIFDGDHDVDSEPKRRKHGLRRTSTGPSAPRPTALKNGLIRASVGR